MKNPEGGPQMHRRDFLRNAGAAIVSAATVGAMVPSGVEAAQRPKKVEKKAEMLEPIVDVAALHRWVKEFRERLSPSEERKLGCSLSSNLSFTNPQGAPDIAFVVSGERFTNIIFGTIKKYEILRLPKGELDRLKTLTETLEIRKEFEEKLKQALKEKGLYRE
ncbi:hypothetical protein A3A39_00445 [Candidatus Kaiserbacteria bacterium RIFCSPLOWO2_01_FULL_54_13]|uniref:Twin-arginine translocation signal domain-containing protein n=1 Tax=Candidatus Kaiserbacteria bacterium RIFCSPLOWO2_01_FULL_54_13 TaxID=1798512 RepID=A0A1F6F0N6_9BACT|nr:MAG: hypothetical protein A3A39_00445 [Candidatus Kaiserbacteria bacterium RIFCSPLOWO2_01_FULL_54_13]